MLLLALVALGVPLAISLRDRVDAEVRGQARSQADLLAATASDSLRPPRSPTLRRLVRVSSRSVRGRVLVVDSRGRVVVDSAGSGDMGADYAGRPEVAAALRGTSYQQNRGSQTLGGEILATATPVIHEGKTIGAVRVTQSVAAVNDAVRNSVVGLAILGAVVLLLGLAAGVLLSSQIARPIRRLEGAARGVSSGDLATEAPIEGTSEQRTLARAFNEMTARIRRLLQSQRDFVADASHQLRTPLTGVRLQLEELRADTSEGDPRAAALDAGMREVDRLSHIVDELLVLSRAGEHDVPAESLDLADVASRAVERWGKTASERGIGLRLESLDTQPRVWAAPADVDRALDALVENAVNYSPESGEIVVRAGQGEIEVLDRGPGIALDEAEVVFERFARGTAGRSGPPGTGLGLAIARELAGQWGGRVDLAPRDGGGVRARIRWAPEPAIAGGRA